MYKRQAITGTGQVIKNGTGSLTMASKDDNTYSGGTLINEGALVVDKDSDLGATSGSITLGVDNTCLLYTSSYFYSIEFNSFFITACSYINSKF